MENIKDTNVEVEQKTTTTSQEDIDNAVASAKARWNKKLEKDYVSVEKYNELQAQLTQAQNELKLPKIKELLTKSGVKSEAINDFIKLNPSLMEMDEKAIVKLLAEAKKNSAYMFNAQNSFNATVGDNAMSNDNGVDISNGSLLRTH